ncbi:MAG: hypothetical protein PHZ26_03960 [Candidatus Gracilibacteria bacterium]|nr:hypothetical protein [Candidatus Gracilibacteria bacterium]MDD2908883.1 hypothetical protein [Candidatus Gracilibacteria bacterium]
MNRIKQKPEEENVMIGYMDDPKKLIVSEDKDKKGYSQELGTIKIGTYGKRLSDLLNNEEIFLEYENKTGELITINKNAILFIILDGKKSAEEIKYESSQLRIELKRGIEFSGMINIGGKTGFRQSLEKRWFIPVDVKQGGVFRTAIINRNNIMRIIEHKS